MVTVYFQWSVVNVQVLTLVSVCSIQMLSGAGAEFSVGGLVDLLDWLDRDDWL